MLPIQPMLVRAECSAHAKKLLRRFKRQSQRRKVNPLAFALRHEVDLTPADAAWLLEKVVLASIGQFRDQP